MILFTWINNQNAKRYDCNDQETISKTLCLMKMKISEFCKIINEIKLCFCFFNIIMILCVCLYVQFVHKGMLFWSTSMKLDVILDWRKELFSFFCLIALWKLKEHCSKTEIIKSIK